MEINEKLAILTDAVTSLMESNKALSEQVKGFKTNNPNEQNKAVKQATDEELDDLMTHL